SARGSVHGNTAAVHPDERELGPGARKAVEERVTTSDDHEKDDEDSKRHRVSHDVLPSLPGLTTDGNPSRDVGRSIYITQATQRQFTREGPPQSPQAPVGGGDGRIDDAVRVPVPIMSMFTLMLGVVVMP